MHKETLHETFRSMFTDENGNLNSLHIQILQETEKEMLVRFFDLTDNTERETDEKDI